MRRVYTRGGIHVQLGRLRRQLDDVDHRQDHVGFRHELRHRNDDHQLWNSAPDQRQRITRLELQMFENNPAAIRLYQHLGFEHEGRRRRTIAIGGTRIDSLIMALEIIS